MKVVLHLGAHKTASTYLQARLGNSTNALAARRVAFLGPEAVRETLARAGSLHHAQRPVAVMSRRRMGDAMARLIEGAASDGAARAIISDEALLGRLTDVFDKADLFGSARGRLKAFRRALDGPDLDILISIRGFAGFLPSVWSHMVLRRGYSPFDMGWADRMLDAPRRWADVVQDVASVFPKARLIVWRYEDLRLIEDDVLRAFAGDEGLSAIEPIQWQALAGLSAPAVTRLEEIMVEGTRPDRGRVQTVSRRFPKPKGHPAYRPFPPEKCRKMQSDYENDLARIAGLDRVTLIRPEDQFGKNVRKNAEASQPAASATRIETMP